MTQKEFEKLPLMLTPGQARRVFGCEPHVLRQLRSANPNMATKLKGMGQWRYYKSVVAVLAKVNYT